MSLHRCPNCQELLSSDPEHYICPGRVPPTVRGSAEQPPFWPFPTLAEQREYLVIRAKAIALLRDAHERYIAAIEQQP